MVDGFEDCLGDPIYGAVSRETFWNDGNDDGGMQRMTASFVCEYFRTKDRHARRATTTLSTDLPDKQKSLSWNDKHDAGDCMEDFWNHDDGVCRMWYEWCLV